MRFILLALERIVKIPRAVAVVRTRRPRKFESIRFSIIKVVMMAVDIIV